MPQLTQKILTQKNSAHGVSKTRVPATRLWLFSSTPEIASLLLAFHCSNSEPGDKSVEEQIVKERDRQAGNQASCHQRSPKIYVTPNQKDRNPYAHHLV